VLRSVEAEQLARYVTKAERSGCQPGRRVGALVPAVPIEPKERTPRPGVGSKLTFFLALEGLDRQIVRIERTRSYRDGRLGTGVGRRSIEPRQGDVLLVD